MLNIAEKRLTAEEFWELLSLMAHGEVDMRIYDDGVVLMRDYRNGHRGTK